MKQLLTVIEGRSLTTEEAREFMQAVMKGEVSEIVLAAFLTAMRMKGETSAELLGFAKAMRENAVKPSTAISHDFVDNCGTGGDGKGSVNISTLAALTLASMGVPIAKHGNRSVSSLCGSSDLLAELGFKLDKPHAEVEGDFSKNSFAFLFAPQWHPSMKYAANVRKELGFRTVFNMLGPLANPFHPDYQVIGVFSRDIMHKMMDVLIGLGIKKAVICHSRDGMDEFSIFDKTDYLYYDGKSVTENVFSPQELGLADIKPDGFFCQSREDAVAFAKKILAGEETAGLYGVALNAGVALFASGKVQSVGEGYNQAVAELKSGKVQEYITKLNN